MAVTSLRGSIAMEFEVTDLVRDDDRFVFGGLTAGDVDHEGATVEKAADAMANNTSGLVVLELKVFKLQGGGDNGVALAVALAFGKGALMALARLEADVPPCVHASVLSQPIALPFLWH
jgi:hypothetical protein